MLQRFAAGAVLLFTLLAGADPIQALAYTSDRLQKRLNDLPKDPVAVIPMPILFGVAPSDLDPNFGDPRSGGRRHEGQDIMAPRRSLIISPTKAVVTGIGVWPGAGNYVSTVNPGGEKFVYMHLDRIAEGLDEGDRLDAGDLIGYVGNTGNAAGGAPHLHLEIRRNAATDPYPRLKGEFTLAQKIAFVEEIIEDSKDEDAMVDFLVANYRGYFIAAKNAKIDLPEKLEEGMQGKIAKAAPAIPGVKVAAAAVATFQADLEMGARGSAVVALQNFLISQKKGPAATALAKAGATGLFGAITRNALVEYQKSSGISPASGYFGPITRAYATAALNPRVSSALN